MHRVWRRMGDNAAIEIHDAKDSYGWDGDGGIGERLIRKIIEGKKTATCCPKFAMTEAELAESYANVGTIVTITNKHGVPRCNVRILECFETTFGDPAPRLLEGEGSTLAEFQENHRRAWGEWLAGLGKQLTDDLVLFGERFELVDVP
ncbi:MAG: ASCH domain-containing protein [Planctomycetota bacterium]